MSTYKWKLITYYFISVLGKLTVSAIAQLNLIRDIFPATGRSVSCSNYYD